MPGPAHAPVIGPRVDPAQVRRQARQEVRVGEGVPDALAAGPDRRTARGRDAEARHLSLGPERQLLQQLAELGPLAVGQHGDQLLLLRTAQGHGSPPDVGTGPGDLHDHPAAVVRRLRPLYPATLLQAVEPAGHPGPRDAEVVGQVGGGGRARRVADHQRVQRLVLVVLQADLGHGPLDGALEVLLQPADARHHGFDLVVEADVDPVRAPPRDVPVGPVGVGHRTRIVLRRLLVR